MADGFSYEEMLRMQSEAAQRVKEMQKRTQAAVDRAKNRRNSEAQKAGLDNNQKKQPGSSSFVRTKSTSLPLDYLNNAERQSPTEGQSYPRDNNISLPQSNSSPPSPDTESDKLLLTFIILLLASEQSDDVMLAALIYLFV